MRPAHFALAVTLGALPLALHAAPSGVTPTKASAQQRDDAPHAYCWTRRDTGQPGANTYYFSHVFRMAQDGPTIGFQPSFDSFVSARHTSEGRGSGASCTRFYGRQEADRHMNDLAASTRRNGTRVVLTGWRP